MYEGFGVEDEVAQNVRDQQHPPLAQTQPIAYVPPAVISVLGLSKRQIDLINNQDDGLPQTGAARERRLEILYRDISAINNFLPYMDQVRGFMSTMPTNEDEGLIEALGLCDMKLRHFIGEVNATLASLETELNLKKATV